MTPSQRQLLDLLDAVAARDPSLWVGYHEMEEALGYTQATTSTSSGIRKLYQRHRARFEGHTCLVKNGTRSRRVFNHEGVRLIVLLAESTPNAAWLKTQLLDAHLERRRPRTSWSARLLNWIRGS